MGSVWRLLKRLGGRTWKPRNPQVYLGCDNSKQRLALSSTLLRVNSPKHGETQGCDTSKAIGEDQPNDDLWGNPHPDDFISARYAKADRLGILVASWSYTQQTMPPGLWGYRCGQNSVLWKTNHRHPCMAGPGLRQEAGHRQYLKGPCWKMEFLRVFLMIRSAICWTRMPTKKAV